MVAMAIHYRLLFFKTHTETWQIGDACSFSDINKKYIWKDENAGQYEHNLLFEDDKFDDLNTQMQQATSSQQIDENIKHFEILIGNVCDPLFFKKIHSLVQMKHLHM